MQLCMQMPIYFPATYKLLGALSNTGKHLSTCLTLGTKQYQLTSVGWLIDA